MNAPSTAPSQLEFEIPATTSNESAEIINSSQAMTNQETRGEHSLEPLTPTSIVNLLEDDEGPNTPEGALTPERVEENEQRCHKRRLP